jgi:enamine deaminase RidA (YjgF/YER057c/UK114 family)
MEILTRLSTALRDADATILSLTFFGDVSANPAAMEALRRVFGRVDWPITWVGGAACGAGPIAGVQVFGFSGGTVHRLVCGKRVVGSVFEAGGARHCVLGGIGPVRNLAANADQTRESFENLARALAQGGFSLTDTMRTWFYLDEILAWYDQFNRTRTAIYAGVQFRTGSLPASTGVGAQNPAHAALTMGAWAVQPLRPSSGAAEIASPLQCPAPAYGSSFSRAMELASASGRRLFISGTASIAPGGATLWAGNVPEQVAQSMTVVDAILGSRGMGFSDVTRATAYFKRRADAPAFTHWCAARALQSLPVVLVECDICRTDLLFELEAEAWKSTAGPTPSRS